MVGFLGSFIYIYPSDFFFNRHPRKNNASNQEWETKGQFMY